MRLEVKGKNVEVSDAVRAYAEEKLGKLERQLNGETVVELELWEERNPSIAASHVAEGTVWTKGPVLRARESSPDVKASIDQLADKLERQVKRYRDKRTRRQAEHIAQHHAPPEPAQVATLSEEDEAMIVKTKQFNMKPMSDEEALLQLELIGHDFFVFVNAESDEVNVIYKRRDGNYGLIEPTRGE
jgi:putative sigma-54 modulation protein